MLKNIKDISTYLFESDLDAIIKRNLSEISDSDISTEVRDYMGDDLSQADIINTWGELKKKLGTRPQPWVVQTCADIDEYDDRCKAWAKATIKKYNITKRNNLERILTGIAWVMNGI